MPLEYAIDELFSIKFDVFNFSILVSEVISGHPLELIDTCLASSCALSDALCGHPEDRSNMASVIIMLGSEIALAHPKHLVSL